MRVQSGSMKDATRKVELRFYTTEAEAEAIRRAAKARESTVSTWTQRTMRAAASRVLAARGIDREDAAA